MTVRVPVKIVETERFYLAGIAHCYDYYRILAALIGPKIIGRVGESRQTVAKQQIEGFSSALEMYKLDTTKYPSQEQGLEALVTAPQGVSNWKGPYLRKSLFQRIRGGIIRFIFVPVSMEILTSSHTGQTAVPEERVKIKMQQVGNSGEASQIF